MGFSGREVEVVLVEASSERFGLVVFRSRVALGEEGKEKKICLAKGYASWVLMTGEVGLAM